MEWSVVMEGLAAELRAADQAEATVALRRSHLRQFAAVRTSTGELAHPDPLLVTRDQVVAWLGRPNLAAEYRRSVRSSLVVLYRWLEDEQLLPGPSPVSRLRPIRIPPGEPRPADDDVIAEALARADARTLLMVRLAAELGLRRAEVAAADTRLLELGGLRVRGKGRRERVVPLPRDLRAVLRRLPRGWVFPSTHGRHLTPGHVGRLVSALLPEGVTPHQLRHAAATAWHDAGLDIADIRPLLGHASLNTTDRYVLKRSAKARAAVEQAAGRLSPAARRRQRDVG